MSNKQEPKPSDENIFEESASNPAGLKEQLLGPDYPYYKYIKYNLDRAKNDKYHCGRA